MGRHKDPKYDKLVEFYYAGSTLLELAGLCGITKAGVYDLLKRRGCRFRRRGRPRKLT